MTDSNEPDTLRMFAKRLSRKLQIVHHSALDIIAKQQGHAHWNGLMKAWNKGWLPAPWDLIDINEPFEHESAIRGVGLVKTTESDIAGEPYILEVGFDEVLIGGRGWTIRLDHAPSKPAKIETYTKPNPLDDKAFLAQAMKLAMEVMDGVRDAIAKDWGASAMQSDADDRIRHPLFGGVSNDWFCILCDSRWTGAQMAANMWHCPKCSATPLDIHSAPPSRAPSR